MLFSALTLGLTALAQAADVTVYQEGIPFFPSPLPAPGAASNYEEIITQFNRLGRTTVWDLVKKIKIEGDTGEPEGMVNLGEERFIVARGNWTEATTSYGKGNITNGTDRSPGAGYAHLNIYDGQGKPIADAQLTELNDIEYHIGGIEWDGEVIWATLAQYRPNTTATIVTINPETLDQTVIARYRDHLGGVVHDKANHQIATLNWGSRNASLWNLTDLPTDPAPGDFSEPVSVTRNPSFYADYQDCKFLGHSETYEGRPVMICSGVTTLSTNCTIGGLAIVDVQTMTPLSEVPLVLKSDLGVQVTQNPFDVDVVDGRMRVYFMPDQHNSTIYFYEPKVDSPFQFGGGEL